MRILGTLVAACLLAVSLHAGPVGDVWQPPRQVPGGCASIEFEAVLVDVSKSMKHGGLFIHFLKDIEGHLADTAPCTLVVLGSFGVTADVDEAQFLATNDGRSRLVSALRHLRATHTSTNLDEAAKLIELLSYQLRDAYGTQANRLVVHVYSDFASSPSTGKPNFSLGEYLARRMDARYIRVYAGDSPAERAVNVQSTQVTEGAQTPHPAKPGRRFGPFALAVSGGVILLAALPVLIWLRRRSRNSLPHGGGLDALLVTEGAVPAEGGAAGAVGTERGVAVAPGVPVVFSTDANSATYVASVVPGAEKGELFRVEPLADGCVCVQSPYPRLKVDIREPIRVRLGPREFNIIGVFGRPRARERTDDVFDAEALQH
jgi:hypothetical protein